MALGAEQLHHEAGEALGAKAGTARAYSVPRAAFARRLGVRSAFFVCGAVVWLRCVVREGGGGRMCSPGGVLFWQPDLLLISSSFGLL